MFLFVYPTTMMLWMLGSALSPINPVKPSTFSGVITVRVKTYHDIHSPRYHLTGLEFSPHFQPPSDPYMPDRGLLVLFDPLISIIIADEKSQENTFYF